MVSKLFFSFHLVRLRTQTLCLNYYSLKEIMQDKIVPDCIASAAANEKLLWAELITDLNR